MTLNLGSFETLTSEAVSLFWRSRQQASKDQLASGSVDQGGRSAVTAGKNLDGFVRVVKDLVRANGLPDSCVYERKSLVILPGFFRPTKAWDVLLVHDGKLIGALEFKSQVGPSFGNNLNNRCEEAIGNATDLWTAYREGAFQADHRPFLGFLMLLEDCPESCSPVSVKEPHFPVFPEFNGASYAARYDLMCKKLVQEGLYESACLLLSEREPGARQGTYRELGVPTGIRSFVTAFAARIAIAASM